MGFGGRALAALGKVGIVLAVIVAFIFGMLGTVYLSLRTAEVKVPDVLGKDRFTAETMLDDAGLKLRVRGTRPSAEMPDTILSQLPEAGEVVKAGIPVAVEVSRAPKEGESVQSSTEQRPQEAEKPAENANANQSTTTTTNQNQNQNKPPKNKNTNKNANNKNANNSNNGNANRNDNANRNANNQNANANRNTNDSNRNANTPPNTNRTTNDSNTNKRAPVNTAPPVKPGANTGTP